MGGSISRWGADAHPEGQVTGVTGAPAQAGAAPDAAAAGTLTAEGVTSPPLTEEAGAGAPPPINRTPTLAQTDPNVKRYVGDLAARLKLLKQWRGLFERCDLDKDGRLQLSECLEVRKLDMEKAGIIFGSEEERTEHEALLKYFQENKLDSIDFNQYYAFVTHGLDAAAALEEERLYRENNKRIQAEQDAQLQEELKAAEAKRIAEVAMQVAAAKAIAEARAAEEAKQLSGTDSQPARIIPGTESEALKDDGVGAGAAPAPVDVTITGSGGGGDDQALADILKMKKTAEDFFREKEDQLDSDEKLPSRRSIQMSEILSKQISAEVFFSSEPDSSDASPSKRMLNRRASFSRVGIAPIHMPTRNVNDDDDEDAAEEDDDHTGEDAERNLRKLEVLLASPSGQAELSARMREVVQQKSVADAFFDKIQNEDLKDTRIPEPEPENKTLNFTLGRDNSVFLAQAKQADDFFDREADEADKNFKLYGVPKYSTSKDALPDYSEHDDDARAPPPQRQATNSTVQRQNTNSTVQRQNTLSKQKQEEAKVADKIPEAVKNLNNSGRIFVTYASLDGLNQAGSAARNNWDEIDRVTCQILGDDGSQLMFQVRPTTKLGKVLAIYLSNQNKEAPEVDFRLEDKLVHNDSDIRTLLPDVIYEPEDVVIIRAHLVNGARQQY